jgi:hypothetical protein
MIYWNISTSTGNPRSNLVSLSSMYLASGRRRLISRLGSLAAWSVPLLFYHLLTDPTEFSKHAVSLMSC